jgi:hypothetical protein
MIISFLIYVIGFVFDIINIILPNFLILPQAVTTAFVYFANVAWKLDIILPVATAIECLRVILWALSLIFTYKIIAKVIGLARGSSTI